MSSAAYSKSRSEKLARMTSAFGVPVHGKGLVAIMLSPVFLALRRSSSTAFRRRNAAASSSPVARRHLSPSRMTNSPREEAKNEKCSSPRSDTVLVLPSASVTVFFVVTAFDANAPAACANDSRMIICNSFFIAVSVITIR